MAKKSNEQLERELQEKIDVLSTNYVELIIKCDEVKDKEEEADKKIFENLLQQKSDTKKQLESYKRDLKFIQSMKGKVDKKAEKEKLKSQKEIVTKLKEIKNSIGDLIADIPK